MASIVLFLWSILREDCESGKSRFIKLVAPEGTLGAIKTFTVILIGNAFQFACVLGPGIITLSTPDDGKSTFAKHFFAPELSLSRCFVTVFNKR
jgi:hypothetical protein